MKRMMLLLAAAALAAGCGLLPWRSSDAAALLPVETLLLDYEDGQVRLSAADGRSGEGSSLAAAMEDLASRAPGELFVGQVARVAVRPTALRLLPGAAADSLLRLNTAVYTWETDTLDIDAGEPYWRAAEQRGTLTTLLQYCTEGKAPVRITEGDA